MGECSATVGRHLEPHIHSFLPCSLNAAFCIISFIHGKTSSEAFREHLPPFTSASNCKMSTAGDIDLTKSKQPQLRVLLIAMMIVPTVVVLIRAWSRALLPVSPLTRIPTKFWWDDWMAFFGAV